MDPILAWWAAQARAPDGPKRLKNKPPLAGHVAVMKQAMKFAMGKYASLGSVWAPR